MAFQVPFSVSAPMMWYVFVETGSASSWNALWAPLVEVDKWEVYLSTEEILEMAFS